MTTLLAGIGRLFFAVGLIAFGIGQFIYGDFLPGRAPEWPAAMPGRLIWAYLSGAILVAAGLAIATGVKARWAAIVAGAIIFVWALLRHLPALATEPNGLVLTQTGKALALFGGAFAVAGSLSEIKGSSVINSTDGFILLGRICLGAFMVLAGIQHFYYAEFVSSLVPLWVPGKFFWTYFTGVALIAGGAGMIIPKTVWQAAVLSGLMIFLWVFLLHIPRAILATSAQTRNEWTAVFEALAFAGVAFVIAGNYRKGSA